MKKFPTYNDRIVAFIDILGFGSLISSLKEQPDLHARIYSALSQIKSTYKDSLNPKKAPYRDLEINQFSDSIVISSKPNFVGFNGVIFCCGYLHAELLYLGILTRGGISIGPTVHESGLLYGEGMLKAYEIESRASFYPRVVIDDNIFTQLNLEKNNKLFLAEDFDGLWLIDPFEFEAIVPGQNELVADGHDPRAIYFSEVGRHIKSGLSDATQIDHKAKWKWLSNRYEVAYAYYLNGGKSTTASIRESLAVDNVKLSY